MVVSQFLVYSEGKGRGGDILRGDILGGRGEEIYWEGGRRYTGRVGGRWEEIYWEVGRERGGYLQDTFN